MSLAQEYKTRFAETNGSAVKIRALQEWLRQAYVDQIADRLKPKPLINNNGVEAPKSGCRICGADIAPTGRRGRPASRCKSCSV